MSAFVCDKTHFDVLVRAAKHYGGQSGFQWWRTDAEGGYAGWYKLDFTLGDDYAGERDDDYMHYLTPSQAGQLLVSENIASVSYRYSEPGRTGYYGAETAAGMEDDTIETLPGPCDRYYMAPYVFADPGYVLTPAEVFKAIDCLDYQSCEHPEWRASEAFAFLDSLRQSACNAVRGYSDSPWDWSSDDLEKGKQANPEGRRTLTSAPFRR